jgi:PmbA protein
MTLAPAEQTKLLTDVVEQAIDEARRAGATSAEAGASTGQGLNVTVRLGEVETVEHTRDKSLAVTVYFGSRTGSASTSDLSPAALRETVRAACTIARFTAEDPCNGLADAARMAWEARDLDLYHPWEVSVDQAIERAQKCEAAARGYDPRIQNSEGATLASQEGLQVYGNTHGFVGSVASTRHSLSCAVIGRSDGGMQRDYWYSAARSPDDLDTPESVGRRAAQRAVRRLDARKPPTCRVPVLYEAPVAASLLGHFVAAVRGGNLYRGASFLVDAVNTPVFAGGVNISEEPHIARGAGSVPFDNEGVATAPRELVADGVLKGYVLDSYSARKLGMETTGNAGGVHNLVIEPGTEDLDALVSRMGRGLLVTELIGFGVNVVTGDYSRGAAGFWVEDGALAYPVEEITIAGNLREMFRDLSAVGSDVDRRGNVRTGSLLIGELTVAGA